MKRTLLWAVVSSVVMSVVVTTVRGGLKAKYALGALSLVVGIVVSLIALSRASGDLETAGYGIALWITLPYLLVAVLAGLLRQEAHARPLLWAGSIVVGIGLLFYLEAATGHPSAFAGFAFTAIPFVQLIVLGISIAVAFVRRIGA